MLAIIVRRSNSFDRSGVSLPLIGKLSHHAVIRLPIARNACVTLALALLFGCHADSPQIAPLTPVAQEIQRRGYQVKKRLILSPTAWEVATFRMRSKRSFSFRANQPLPNERNTYCRFSFYEETYDSVEDAKQRLSDLHRPSPDAEDDRYVRAMRTGFRVGPVTYVLETDAIIFWDEVQRLGKALADSTPGAELSRVINQQAPNQILWGGVWQKQMSSDVPFHNSQPT